MFGTLRIAKSRLSEAEDELYRSHFCGSCHAMREAGGRLSSLLTNYDQTVLAIVLGGLANGVTSFRPCTAIPFRSVPVTELPDAMRRYLAAVNTALVVAKLIDDVDDGDAGLLRRAGWRMMRGRTRTAHAELEDLGFPLDAIVSLPARQTQAELVPKPELDDLAMPSAKLTGEIFAAAAPLADGDTDPFALARDLRSFGHALGHFVYVLDAWIDREEDRRRGRFNALDACCGRDDDGSVAVFTMRQRITRMRNAVEALPLGDRAPILGHLLDSLEHRLNHHLAPRSAEAGDCDCGACDCGDCCSGDCNCCDGSPTACDCCCVPCDCCGERRRRRREQQR